MHFYNSYILIIILCDYIIYRCIGVSTLGCNFLSSPENRPTSSYNLPDETYFFVIGGVMTFPPISPC